jgi:hypothetical protein
MNVTEARAAAGEDQLTDSAQCVPAKLKLAPAFEPCPIEGGDEVYRNGIFDFNITRLTAFIEAHTDRFPIEAVAVASTPNYGDSRLDQTSIAAADLARPVLFAEIAPSGFNLIDGNHRMAFLTSLMAYQKYVEYWNGKVKEMLPKRPRASSKPRAAHG